jgi:hypothetical protein
MVAPNSRCPQGYFRVQQWREGSIPVISSASAKAILGQLLLGPEKHE